MRRLFAALVFLVFVACKERPKSLQEIKDGFGDFGDKSIKLQAIDYTNTPIYKVVAHHPGDYKYLDDINIYRVGHKSDGLFLTGLLVAPKKEGKYPVIVFNRGGNRDLGALIVATAVNELAPIAAQGYVVVASNYRGTSRSEGSEQFGGDDVNDVKNLISSMAEIDKADVSRIGLLGISRGGMMNYLTLKSNPDKSIKAVVNIGGITDLAITMKYHPQIEEVVEELIPNFNKNRNIEIKNRSAVHWTGSLSKTTPLLILHSTNDQHVDYSQIAPFADNLEKDSIPYKLVSFENDVHGLTKHKVLVRKMIIDWFDNNVKVSNSLEQNALRETVN